LGQLLVPCDEPGCSRCSTSQRPLDAYGLLLLAKVAGFGGMVGLAALNRFCLTRLLAEESEVGIRLSLLLETSLAFAILALVALLGRLSPLGS